MPSAKSVVDLASLSSRATLLICGKREVHKVLAAEQQADYSIQGLDHAVGDARIDIVPLSPKFAATRVS